MASTDSIDSRFNTRVLFEGGLRVLLVLVVALLLLVSLDWLLQSDTYQADQLQFEGSFEHVSEAELEQAILPAVKGNYLMLDLDEIRAAAESLPWVNRAWVRRSWPSGVHIRFVEEQPVAYWGESGSLGADGHVIPAVKPDAASSLPHLAGPDGSARTVLASYNQFENIVRKMGERIQSLTLTSRRTWHIKLVNGLSIVVDRDRAEKKLERFVRVQAHVEGTPERVDLRYTNGFAVDWGAARKGARSSKQE